MFFSLQNFLQQFKNFFPFQFSYISAGKSTGIRYFVKNLFVDIQTFSCKGAVQTNFLNKVGKRLYRFQRQFGLGFAGQCLFYLFETVKDDCKEIGEESDSDS